MIEGKWFPPGGDIQGPLALRQEIFGTGRDATDDIAWQVVVLDAGIPAATGRIWWRDGAFCIGTIGVLAAHRRRGLGDLVVRLLLFKATEHHAKVVRLQAPKAMEPFFATYGFTEAGQGEDGLVALEWDSENPMIPPCQRKG